MAPMKIKINLKKYINLSFCTFSLNALNEKFSFF